MLAIIRSFGFSPKWIHIANSAGLLKIDDPVFTAVRSGIAFYGYNHLEHNDPHFAKLNSLSPALRVLSTVISLQQLQSGDIVSYGGTHLAQSPERIATLPFGYYEGLTRSLSNRRSVKCKDTFLPQVGNICMNLSSYVCEEQQVQLGDRVEVIGIDIAAPNSIDKFSKLSGTIPYEVLVNLDAKIRRKVV